METFEERRKAWQVRRDAERVHEKANIQSRIDELGKILPLLEEKLGEGWRGGELRVGVDNASCTYEIGDETTPAYCSITLSVVRGYGREGRVLEAQIKTENYYGEWRRSYALSEIDELEETLSGTEKELRESVEQFNAMYVRV